jgi:hypothetical protein
MRDTSSAHANKLKTAKWLFAIAALFFVVKPFVGFAVDGSSPLVEASILVKSFTKRKHEYVENSDFDVQTIQRHLADPVSQLFLLFSCLLSTVFPLIFGDAFDITCRFIRKIKVNLSLSPDTWLLNGQLVI